MPRLLAVALPVLIASCMGDVDPNGALPLGTWGGENAAAMVDDTMHVHIGCTYGNAARPSLVAGRFEVAGEYNVNAYPVNRGILHPATFAGQVSGDDLTLTVTLTDTAVVLGPVVVRLGRDPRMGPCPI